MNLSSARSSLSAIRRQQPGSAELMKIRKQVYQLTLDDLERTPVWEFALDEEVEEGQDEATVRPVEGPFPLDPAGGMFVVRARFRLGDGTRLTG